MADIDLKTSTPDTSLPTTGFLFGADSQAASAPSVFTVQSVATTLLGSTTLSGATITADAPVLDLSQTWNNAAVTFTGLRFNATDTASAAASLLMDIGTGGGTYASKFRVNKEGSIFAAPAETNEQIVLATGSGSNNAAIRWRTGNKLSFANGNNSVYIGIEAIALQLGGLTKIAQSGGTVYFSNYADNAYAGIQALSLTLSTDAFLTRRGTANLRLGAADTTGTTAPTPQFLSAQSWASSTNNNQTGANFTIDGSQGTGTGAGGSIIFRVAPAGAISNGVQNALAAALTISTSNTFASDLRCDYLRANTFVQLGGTSGSYISGPANDTFGFNSIAGSIVKLTVEANNTLALRNGNEGQTFRLYGRFTDITNDFERFFINAPTTSGAAVLLGTQKGATTGAARNLELQTNGATRLTIPSNGGVWTTSGEYFHFRASANTSVSVLSPADGVMTLGNWNADNFNRLQFGGTTSAFPALKRVSANLQVIAADGTSSAGLIVGNQALSTTATDGFLYVPTCAGTPTGTPTTQTGTVPIVVDTTNHKLYFYSNATWQNAGP